MQGFVKEHFLFPEDGTIILLLFHKRFVTHGNVSFCGAGAAADSSK